MSLKIRMQPPVYVSRTTTQTVRPTAAPSGAIPMVLKMPKKESIQKNTEALLKSMRESLLFDSEKLAKAIADFSKADLGTDKGLADVTEVLCDLIANMIRPAMLKAAGDLDTQGQMLDFDDDAQRILELSIPAGKQVKDIVQEYTERSDKAKHCLREAEAIDDIYASAVASIDRSDEDLAALAEDLFNTKKAALLRQNEERKEAADSVNRALDVLTDRVDRMSDRLLTGLVSLKQDMDKEKTSRQRVISQALAITGGV